MVTGQISKMMGASVKRREDPRLITGEGKYTDDVQLPRMAYLYFVRSPYAHARVRGINVSKALEDPNVLAVLTGEEVKQRVAGPMPVVSPLPGMHVSERWPLAVDKVNFQGEAVAAVVATSRAAAKDAAELVEVDWEPLPAVVDIEKALEQDSPLIYEEFGTNACYEAPGQTGDVDKAFQEADGVVSLRIEQPRVIPNPMEPRAVVANYDRGTGHLDMWVTTQNPHIERLVLASLLNFPENKLRVVAIDVGGGFGCKINVYPESVVAALLSMDLGRPIKWTEERSENFLVTSHGRGQVQYVEAAYKNDGTLLGMRIRVINDLGAYAQAISHIIPTLTPLLSPGVYKNRNIAWTTIGVYTNKTPYDAYRGAGRPEAAFLIERVMDRIAQETGLDPVEVRRRNFIPKDAFPYETPTGLVYDSADYEAALSKALELAEYDKLREEQRRLREQGILMGIGVTTTTEVCGFGPAEALAGLGGYESATVRIHPTGKVTILTGSSPHGQGEETSFAQIAADDLQIPFEDIEVVHGDTDVVPKGVGTFGSRALVVGGTAILRASAIVKERARQIAAALLEVEPERVILEGGRWMVEDVQDKYVTWAQVAAEAYDARRMPYELERGLEATYFWEPPNFTFPFSAHVCVVRVDPETGDVRIVKYVAVDDCGVRINPMLVEGQIHGGIAQGVGQALLEQAVYDESGQLITGSLMDYPMPLAEHLPMYTTDATETPSPNNPMGAKGIGEMATIAATPTVVAAVVDALSHLGVTHIDVPMTPERVWRTIQEHSKQ